MAEKNGKNYQLRPSKRGRGFRVFVYYYDGKTRKHTWVPRKQTKHLDGKPIKEIEAWVDAWKKEYGIEKEKIRRVTVSKKDKLSKLFTEFQTYRQNLRDITDHTMAREKDRFERYMAPFFVRVKKQRNPARWHKHIPEYYTYLNDLGIEVSSIKKLLWDLERFGKYLVFIKYMDYPFSVMIPRRSNRKITPLKRRIEPDDILSARFSNLSERRDQTSQFNHRLAILIGYFATLGPSELFALEKKDFLTGAEAKANSKTYKGFAKHGLGSGLSVIISKGLKGNKQDPYPKNFYRYGVVNIFSVEAAKEIAKLLKHMPDGKLFTLSRFRCDKIWEREIKPTIHATPHDLRRASCLYLGRTLRIEPTLLQEHARHSELDTTMLYCRDPLVPHIKVEDQDFDDVS